jgi:hypothetical protein
MKKACSILKKPFAILCIALGLVCILGILAFSIAYNETTLNLELDSFVSILFLAVMGIVFVLGIVFSVVIRKICPSDKVSNSRVSTVCSAISAAAMLALFLSSVIRITAFSLPGKLQIILSIIVCAYFVTEALCEKKELIPLPLRQGLSIAPILWALAGMFDVYFTTNEKLISTSTMFNAQVITYVVMALFFVFDAEDKYLKSKRTVLLPLAIATTLMSVAFSLSLIFCFIFGTVNISDIGLPVFTLLASVGIGIFALSRVYSILNITENE